MQERFDEQFYEGDRNSIHCRKHKVYATPGEIKVFIQSEIDLDRKRFVDKMLNLPSEFWEDQDHAVGGYISKKDLKELLQTLISNL